jgi:hypothetical protein
MSLLDQIPASTVHRSRNKAVDCPTGQPTDNPPVKQLVAAQNADGGESTAPLFGTIAEEYLGLREDGGASEATLSTARLRLNNLHDTRRRPAARSTPSD